MDSEVQTLFLKLADLSPAERTLYFEAHPVDPGVRTEVESLLNYDGESRADSITGVIAALQEEFAGVPPERFCGPYRLVRLLGQGGMGSVFLAQRTDGEVDLHVAIKFVRGFHARFLQERQILASLNHPGIARLLDAGHTELGQPYLVMEYVDGIPIDVYCRKLPLRDKLNLFLLVCDAISYSHRNLIIHRDLKPSNILVQADGRPKLLDFGIAKILDDAADSSATRERLLTPEYASPEQLLGTAKTTATDIYSLGIVLYRLLAGHLPELPLPRLDSSFPRDLDFVLAKALRPEPMERYASVDVFAEDVRAVLESRPVQARSADAWYRTRKFARRHWLPVSALAAAILFLAIGFLVANRERLIAERRFSQLRQLSNRLLQFDRQVRSLPGATKVREEIVSVSTEYLDGLSREVHNDPDLRLELANGYLLTAQVQGVPISPNLGQFKEAKVSLGKAAAQAESVLAASPQRADALLLAAEIEQDKMVVADYEQNWPEVRAHAAKGVGYLEILSLHPTGTQARDASRLFMNTAQGYLNLHQYSDAIRYVRRGLQLAQSSSGPPSGTAQGLSLLANAMRQSGDLEGALQSITEARAMGETAQFPNETLRALGLYAILWRQGLILGEDENVSLNRPDDAIEPLQKAYDLVDLFASKDPNDATFRDRVGTAGQQLADILRHRDPVRALAIYDHTLLRLREVRNNVSARRQEARVLAHSSYPLRTLHRTGEAGQRIADAFALLKPMGLPATPGGEWDDAMRALADQQAATGHLDLAQQTLLDLQAKLQTAHPAPETDLHNAASLSRLYASLARIDNLIGQREEAEKFETMRQKLSRIWNRPLPQ
jgi:serine/threonine protein kinase